MRDSVAQGLLGKIVHGVHGVRGVHGRLYARQSFATLP